VKDDHDGVWSAREDDRKFSALPDRLLLVLLFPSFTSRQFAALCCVLGSKRAAAPVRAWCIVVCVYDDTSVFCRLYSIFFFTFSIS
jgi:hypothetical protein